MAHMSDQPKLTPEQAAEIVAALKRGDAIVCYSKCWPCQFGQCPPCVPHTWMDDEDITHAGLTVPTTGEQWDSLADERPCGCPCNRREDLALIPREASTTTRPCDNEREPDGEWCTGVLTFGSDDVQAQCPTCGGWTGRFAPSTREDA
jgi:hypothetical protein